MTAKANQAHKGTILKEYCPSVIPTIKAMATFTNGFMLKAMLCFMAQIVFISPTKV